jgi:hypothetical protein
MLYDEWWNLYKLSTKFKLQLTELLSSVQVEAALSQTTCESMPDKETVRETQCLDALEWLEECLPLSIPDTSLCITTSSCEMSLENFTFPSNR